jgi:hypothetical protein
MKTYCTTGLFAFSWREDGNGEFFIWQELDSDVGFTITLIISNGT